MGTRPSETTVKRRVLKVIRVEWELAERKVTETRYHPRKHRYAPLFENSFRFWRDLHHWVDQDLPPTSPQQAAVLEILRKNAEKGAGK